MSNFIQGENVVIGENVQIGNGCILGNNVTIHENSIIGENVRIDDNTVIGKKKMKAVTSSTTFDSEDIEPAIIGDGCIIGTNVILYAGCTIYDNCLIADSASIREEVTIGEKTIIGRNVTIENLVCIGDYCKIQSNVQIVPFSIIEDHVFISPGVITSNDNYAGRTEKRKREYKGLTARKGARLGVACVTLPGVTIGEDAFVGGGSLVTKDVPAKKVVYGHPAKVIRDVPEEELLENQGKSGSKRKSARNDQAGSKISLQKTKPKATTEKEMSLGLLNLPTIIGHAIINSFLYIFQESTEQK
jgi:acetyltransferase-like isoleucine patch superfamily enzyme